MKPVQKSSASGGRNAVDIRARPGALPPTAGGWAGGEIRSGNPALLHTVESGYLRKVMRPFLICLSPAILGFVFVLIMVALQSGADALITVAIVLFGIGALLSGGCVARKIVSSSLEPAWWKWTAAVLSFVAVAAAYFAMTMGGCCGLVIATQ